MVYHLERIEAVAASLDNLQHECMITLALKITDDTCKMDQYERSVFMRLYDALPKYKSDFFGSDIFAIIKEARTKPSGRVFDMIQPLREAGMKYVTRPKMKAFKANVREQLT